MKYNQIFHTPQGIRNYVSRHVFIPTLGIKYSHTGNKTFFDERSGKAERPRWEFLRTSLLLLLLLLTTGANQSWGQTPDYSGTYYIASNSTRENNVNNKYSYNPETPAGNYYLCPTYNWYFYKSTSPYYVEIDNGQPFLTTYKCRDGNHDEVASEALWIVKKKEGNCYYIKQKNPTANGKYRYMVSNGAINAGARMRVHLEEVADDEALAELGDKALFELIFDTTERDHIDIKPHSADGIFIDGNDKRDYLVVNNGNYNQFTGHTDKTGGPSGKYGNGTAGIIGLWSHEHNGYWIFEDYITRPSIGFNSNQLIEISDQTGNATAIYYTTDGSEPTTLSTLYSGPFDPADGVTTIKAVAVVNEQLSNVATFTPPVLCGTNHKYLIQSQNNAWNTTDFHFYMIPGNDESGVTKLNTTSLFRPSMEWYFLNAGIEDGVQYFYAVNNANSKYMCYDDTNGVHMEDFGSGGNKFKFSIVESPTTGTFNIKLYGQNNYLNKNTDNANANAINLGNTASNANQRWAFVLPTELDRNAPFTASDPSNYSYSYYTINTVATNNNVTTTYYLAPGATNIQTLTSSDISALWYFEVAQDANNTDWLTYYHIRNAVTGAYLYFDDESYNANVANSCFKTSSTIEGNTERYKFTWAKTASASINYYIVPKLMKDASQNTISTFYRYSNTNIRLDQTRSTGTRVWTFGSSSYTCATPEITWSAGDNGYVITASESDADIYYIIGDGELTPSTGTKYTVPISVAGLSGTSATIRAIAVRSSDGSDQSEEASVTVSKVETPTITLTNDGKVQITCTTDGASIYYEMENTAEVNTPTTSSTPYSAPIENAAGKYIKAIAVKGGWINSAVASSSQIVFACATPVIRKTSSTTFTIECSYPANGVTIYYTKGSNPSDPTTSSTQYNGAVTFTANDLPFTVKAIAVASGYANSEIATIEITEGLTPDEEGYYTIASDDDFSKFITMANGEGPNYKYKITADIDASGTSAISLAFTGELTAVAKADGSIPIISNLKHPLFNTINGGTVKNIILKDVTISSGTNVGAICGEATGASRIYNCGVLGTITEEEVKDPNTGEVTNINVRGSSEFSGDTYVGSIVGLLDGTSRVINCYSYAVMTDGSYVGGIVGCNNVETTTPATEQKTMVMNCMFYGDITGGDSKAPIYNGHIITNVGNNTGVGNYNYFRIEASYVQDQDIDVYNCALAAETRYLNRFEFFRHLLNSNRALAAWWATGNRDNKDEMMKWVLETADRNRQDTDPAPYPYPILKPVKDINNKYIKYPSVVNIDAAHVDDIDEEHEHYNEGRKLGDFTIYIKGVGGGAINDAPTSARILNSDGTPITDGSKRTIPAVITDKDPERFNFNYYKVQLPYYNDYGTNNYKEQRVVTGWKIVEINGSSSGSGTFSTDSQDATAENGVIMSTPYNFADRKCSNKDLYSVSSRVFNQGAYYDVPEGVTSITIEPYWGKAVYVSDPYLDKVYNENMSTGYNVTTIGGGQLYTNGVSVFNGDDNQKIYTTMANAVAQVGTDGNVYDNAIVLVGNTHNSAISLTDNTKSFTLMSVDMDHDNEPDYSYILRFDDRKSVHPVRLDFLSVIGLGMAQKSTGGKGTYNLGIMQPNGWFEVTNTGLFRVTQFEYDLAGRVESPMILQGGMIEQWVTVGGKEEYIVAANSVNYYHVGGNVWFKEFHIGVHQDKTQNQFVSPHPPITVTGGDFDNFYLTGYYNTPNANYPDNAECYINGGRFGKVAGTGMQGLGNTGGTGDTGNIVWQIDNADIDEFYAGGLNAAHIAEGNITTVISNSRVDLFCGGPKFGDMNEGKKVFTNATNCTFRVFFGAGYGGNSYNRRYPDNKFNDYNYGWDTWVGQQYTKKYDSNFKGVETRIDYQFIPRSNNEQNVARLFVDYVSFSLAKTRDVTSKLTGCIITTKELGGRLKDLFQAGNFYGGGNLGKVEGPVRSTLTNCTVEGSAFGGGYSSTLPPVSVMVKTGNKWFLTAPYYDENLGAYLEAKKPATVSATWQHGASNSYDDETDPEHPVLYTTADLTGLGSISGDVTLTLTGTDVGKGENGGSVFGGGEESSVGGSTTVTVTNGTIGNTGAGVDDGNVYGGGRGKELDYEKGLVMGNTSVTINGNPTIKHNIYGGGAFGSVGTFTYDNTTKLPTTVTNGICTVTVNGGTIGTTGHNNGMVFGSSRGDDLHFLTDGTLVNQQAWVKETVVVIGDPNPEATTSPEIKGSVYGGGENGHNFGDAHVTVNKGIIGIAEVTKEDDVVVDNGPADLYRGNVYGSGCGTDTYTDDQGKIYYNPMAGVVGGNAYVTINGGHVVRCVYGAGSMGSVGIYTNNNGKLQCAENTGKCTVIVQGNSKVGTPGMTMPDDWGYVFGGGRGASLDPNIYPLIETYQFVDNTEVTIGGSALIYGSVYGGSENGHVLNNTNVTIKEQCQIGWGVNETEKYTEDQWLAENPSDFSECSHWPFEAPYEPYDIYPITVTKDGDGKVTGYTPAEEGVVKDGTDGHTFYGNVFGGGSGYFPYGRRNSDQMLALLKLDEGYADGLWLRSAGSVGGSTVVNIEGGHILTSVYGGNEHTDVAGSCTINMSGGTVGVPRNFETNKTQQNNRLVTCYVFGAGKGDQRINFNQWTNVASSEVKISKKARIFGSTFGGGEDGHVLGNAKTTITAGEVKNGIQYPYIGTTGTSGADGNVFGGGRGFSETALTAGAVCGNVDVSISGGTMLGSIFGGGRLAPVGTHIVLAENPNYGKLIKDGYSQQFGADDLYEQQFNENGEYDPKYPADVKPENTENTMHGHITVNISGGVIGSSAVEGATTSIGEVFGGCKGTSSQDPEKALLFGLSKTTEVTISQASDEFPTHIYNSVYGGGEAGNVKRGVKVFINGGTIDKDVYGGGKKASTNYDVKDRLVKKIEDSDKDPDQPNVMDSNTLVDLHGGTIKGNVYGGGLGTPEIAAIVGGNVTVNMNYNNGCDNNTQDTDNCVVKGTVFGCNNVNGSPRGNVTVNIYKTVGDKRPGVYELKAVYGGGNEAAYEPTDAYPYMYYYDTPQQKYLYKYDYVSYTLDNNTYKPCTYNESTGEATITSGGIALDDNAEHNITSLADVYRTNVNIYGCNKTSIGEVYGGGNAAPTPATRVTVNGCFEIGAVFGGGNGKDPLANGDDNPGANVGYRNYSGDTDANNSDPAHKNHRKAAWSYGTGKAETQLFGGTIKQAFGGSNTLGNVREVAFSVLDQQNDCDLLVGQIYGAGNRAFMDAKIELDLGCITGFEELFGGAFNADINENVYLKVTSGTFGSVYGGNNEGGHINGTITVEVEETGCYPINIGKLYGGGKLADYTAPSGSQNSPIVRVKSATHIGTVYGGGFQANVTGNPTVEINMEKGVLYQDDETHANEEQNLGTVDNVFGGGFEGWVKGDTKVLIGTLPGKSAQITGNVFGGGDNADVIGKTDVQIGYDDLKPNTQRTTDQ